MPSGFLDALEPGDRARTYEFEKGSAAPTTVVAVASVDGVGGVGDGDDPSLTNSGEVRSGSSPSPVDRAPEGSGGGPVVGFVTFGPSRDRDTVGMGEIYALYVDPGRYEAGVGRLLMAHARWRLKEQGFEAAVLWVLQGNERAASFYEREGWKPDGATREEEPYGITSNVRRFHLEELY
jgi:ribosomal protein S18 acetylase RimI-like enzyme